MRTGVTMVLATLFFVIPPESFAAEKYWVTSDRLNQRTCPSTHCGVVGQLFYRQGVTIHEKKGGWARISKYYDASCRNGMSQYVDSGNARCLPANGIEGGTFAEWVSMRYLAATRPADPGAGATGIAMAIQQSDDLRKYKSQFVKASKKLIESGRCRLEDFEEMGGWLKSTTTYRNEPVYFTYCGGMTRSNRVYLNAANGQIFQ